MKILVDTHAFYWFTEGDPQLSPLARTTISPPANDVLLSPAPYWEIAIKVSMGKQGQYGQMAVEPPLRGVH